MLEIKAPGKWKEWKSRTDQRRFAAVVAPFLWFEWLCEWLSFWLKRWAFIEILEILGKFSVLVAIVFYIVDAANRRELNEIRLKEKHYQAWQVINTAHGKPGSGGRALALKELIEEGASLVGINLSKAYLPGVDLRGLDLTGADFSDAILSDSTLKGAVLRNVDFARAKLYGADLGGTDLRGAVLAEADLREANLRNADIRRMDAKRTNLDMSERFAQSVTTARELASERRLLFGLGEPTPADIEEYCSMVQEIDAERTKDEGLYWADLRGADLSGADLTGAILVKADLSSAVLRNTILREADQRRVNLEYADLRGSDLSRALLVEAKLSGADLRGAVLEQADLTRACFNAADLSHADFTNAVLLNATLVETNLEKIKGWPKIYTVQGAEIRDTRNAPDPFLKWAMEHGATDLNARERMESALKEWEEEQKGPSDAKEPPP